MLSKGCIRLNTIHLNELPSLTDDCIEVRPILFKMLRIYLWLFYGYFLFLKSKKE